MAEEHAPTLLTAAALAKLKDELEHLTTTGRDEIEERIAEARSHGDLRENADYDAAKNEQGLMEARIRKLEHLIHTAQLVEVTSFEEVEVGCLVTVADSDGEISEATTMRWSASRLSEFSACPSRLCSTRCATSRPGTRRR